MPVYLAVAHCKVQVAFKVIVIYVQVLYVWSKLRYPLPYIASAENAGVGIVKAYAEIFVMAEAFGKDGKHFRGTVAHIFKIDVQLRVHGKYLVPELLVIPVPAVHISIGYKIGVVVCVKHHASCAYLQSGFKALDNALSGYLPDVFILAEHQHVKKSPWEVQ